MMYLMMMLSLSWAGLDEIDQDGDGWSVAEGDCDDTDPASWPGAAELCDGLDNDCDNSLSAEEDDADGDDGLD